MNETALQKTNGGREVAIRREEFGAVEERQVPETAAMAMAAHAEALVKARIIQALQRPRDVEQFRVRLLAECRRPGFADAAWYSRPVGGKKPAEGFTIRFMEAAAARYGNLANSASTLWDGEGSRIKRMSVTDLETNVSWDEDIEIQKAVERKGYKGKPPEGREVISSRKNSRGETTYLVVATDAEMVSKQKAEQSKTLRALIERLLDPGVLAECRREVQETNRKQITDDPQAALRRVIDGFAALNVEPSDLKDYIGVAVERANPAHIQQLRDAYKLVSNGEMTWEQIMAVEDPQHGSKEDQDRVAGERLAGLRKPNGSPKGKAPEPPEGAGGKQKQSSGGGGGSASAPVSGDVAAFEAAMANPWLVSGLPTEEDGEIDNGKLIFWQKDPDKPGEFRKWSADDSSWQKAELPTAKRKPPKRARL